MLRPPKRLSLVTQTADLLREHLVTRPAGEKLASERELGHQLGVSRMTLRAALATLAREGLIRAGQGRSRVVVKHGPRAGHRNGPRDVVLLSPIPLHEIEPRVLFWIDELRDTLAKERCALQVLDYRSCYSNRPQRALEKLAARLRPSAWVLFQATPSMQAWFMARGLPTVNAGSCYEGIRLPAVDVDYRAASIHAVGRFLANGHRCLALVQPKRIFAGGLRTEAGFARAGVTAGPEVETVAAQHDGSVEGICATLDRLLARPRPPTAFLVCRPGNALTALGHLVQRGLRFPANAALISRDDDAFLELVVPSMARYRTDLVLFATKLAHLVLEFTAGGNPHPREHLLMPRFIPGQTLK